MVILTSSAWIFLPTYSGVRPTMSPPRNTVTMQNNSIPKSPEPTPPTMTSSTIMFAMSNPPDKGMKLSCMALTAPLDESVVTVANSEDAAMPKRTSLPSMLPPACSRAE